MRKPIRGVSLLLCLVLADAGLAGTLQASMPTPKRAGYDAETIFRGLFFGVGPVASLFPEIWEDAALAPAIAKMRAMPETPALIDGIIARVDANDPELLARFASDVQSGDHVRVSKALEDAGAALQQAAHQETGIDPAGANLSGPSQQGAVAAVSVAVVAAVVVVAVVAAAVLIYVAARHYLYTPGGSPLENDVLVDMIATRLATNAS